jgi:phage gp46-like protein
MKTAIGYATQFPGNAVAIRTPERPATATADWRRDWWGDALAANPGDRIGSHLWLLFRCKQTEETRRRGEEYARAALAWMLEDGVASAVDVEAGWLEPATGILGLAVAIHKPGGKSVERYYFSVNTQTAEAFTYAV